MYEYLTYKENRKLCFEPFAISKTGCNHYEIRHRWVCNDLNGYEHLILQCLESCRWQGHNVHPERITMPLTWLPGTPLSRETKKRNHEPARQSNEITLQLLRSCLPTLGRLLGEEIWEEKSMSI